MWSNTVIIIRNKNIFHVNVVSKYVSYTKNGEIYLSKLKS